MLDAAGSIRVADFGLATLRRPAATTSKMDAPSRGTSAGTAPKAAGSAAGSGGGGEVFAAEPPGDEPFLDLTGLTGSFRFMAPEVYTEKPYGRPVDVYSFAMIAYNILESQ